MNTLKLFLILKWLIFLGCLYYNILRYLSNFKLVKQTVKVIRHFLLFHCNKTRLS